MVWNRTIEMQAKLKALADGTKTIEEIAQEIGRSKDYTGSLLKRLELPFLPKRKGFASPLHKLKTRTPESLARIEQIKQLANGQRTSTQISELVPGTTPKFVQAILLEFDLPRFAQGARAGEINPSFAGGRSIDLDGYVLVSAPKGHPFARILPKKNIGRIYEHRLVMEKHLGRFLRPEEVVDHIDGIHLNNSPENLRVFPSNQDHLRATIRGQTPQWSDLGFQKMQIPPAQRPNYQRVCKYYDQRKCGDVRLKQILLAWLSLDKDSPYLLGSRRWLERSGIFDFSHSSLQLHLQMLLRKWDENLPV